MAKFNKKRPKNYLSYFSPAADEEFKKRHPVKYKVLVAVGLTVLFLPPFLCILLNSIFDAPDSGWLFLAGAGSFIIGVGLFNIVAAWIDQYLGHAVTFGCLGVGALLVTIAELLMFNARLRVLFQEDMVSFYFITLLFLPLPLVYYFLFRCSIPGFMKRKYALRDRDYHKLLRGKRNFLWYEALHREYPMGWLYCLNKSFTIVYGAALVTAILFGFFRKISLITCALLTISFLLLTAMTVFADIQDKIEIYGRPIILFARNQTTKRFDSSLFSLLGVLFLLAAAYVYCAITAALWHISLPTLKDIAACLRPSLLP